MSTAEHGDFVTAGVGVDLDDAAAVVGDCGVSEVECCQIRSGRGGGDGR